MALCVAFKTGGSTWKHKLQTCVLTSVIAVFVTGGVQKYILFLLEAPWSDLMYILSTVGCGCVLLMADCSAVCLLLLTPLEELKLQRVTHN